ncbi:SseB family protein [Phytohabitans sp. ZYX-F-186]|uniref:SseB family protein n=1 Tax=Phytohabitans maris TaxID=3071409 RepID=A0ABU0ZHP2_9ACTN|nr:SseB family protein [Phytohabitans sp. ZYX-F-186]MDQ7906552.1 SseB family protein [Phytohabitans sp. ZYX-F-186]
MTDETGGWAPANDVERDLQRATGDGDIDAVMSILAVAPLVVPGYRDEPEAQPGRQRLLTRERDGVPYLLVFTSPEAMHRAVPADGWRATTLTEVVCGTPDGWGLAVNPVTPIGVLVKPEDVPELVPTERTMRGFTPAGEVERLLRDALVAPDAEVLLDVLVTAQVIVPTQALEMDGVLAVPVFTSAERHEECLGGRDLDVPVVTIDFISVLRQWPGDEYRLAVNPGSPIGVTLPGERVRHLVAYAEQLVRRRLGDGPPPPPPVAPFTGREPPPIHLPPNGIGGALRGEG